MSGNPRHPESVAVVDVGSNSIKLLVAAQGTERSLREIHTASLEVRVGHGIGRSPPVLDSEGMDRAAGAVTQLLEEAAQFNPARIRVVATSAVRDAANGDEFARRVDRDCGRTVEVLSSDEEARLIGRGIASDPALAGVREFALFDLGGGSMELLAFADGAVAALSSLPLGCVRLTEKFVSDPAAALPEEAVADIRRHVRLALSESTFRFPVEPGTPAVLTGGTATTLRAMRAAAENTSLRDSRTTLTVAELENRAREVSELAIDERRHLAGLHQNRADVFPAGLWTLVELAGVAKVDAFMHSLYNLRFGVAAETLGL